MVSFQLPGQESPIGASAKPASARPLRSILKKSPTCKDEDNYPQPSPTTAVERALKSPLIYADDVGDFRDDSTILSDDETISDIDFDDTASILSLDSSVGDFYYDTFEEHE